MKYLLFIMFFYSLSIQAGNWGHRASGGDGEYHSDLPENSLVALKAGLVGKSGREAIQYNDKYKYLEFDIQETYDGKIVVFHDRTISRMIPYKGNNRHVYEDLLNDSDFMDRNHNRKIKYKKLKIRDLKLNELKRFRLSGNFDQEVPTLDEFLDAAREYNLIKPIVVEIKRLHTDKVKSKLLSKVKEFRETYMNQRVIEVVPAFDFPETTAFLAFNKKYKRTYGVKGKGKYWCDQIKANGFLGIFKAGRHSKNFCKKHYKKKKKRWWRR